MTSAMVVDVALLTLALSSQARRGDRSTHWPPRLFPLRPALRGEAGARSVPGEGRARAFFIGSTSLMKVTFL